MEKNRVRIICNPYEKTIKYKRWCSEHYIWKDLGSKSQLLVDEKYTNATIQHNAYEIVKEIANVYFRGKVGLEIVFDGTKEDYEDLKDVVDRFFSDAGVTCEKGDFYIDSASAVMPEIQNVFVNLVQLFSTYSNDSANEINEIISKFLDATKTEVPICVIGMYSTGKSSFINSLIGAEILPSAVNPTTARNYKILESEKTGAIRFFIENEKIAIYFEEDKYKVDGNIDKELSEKLHNSLETVDSPSLTTNMYFSLCTINEYADKTKRIAELIEVEVPFFNGELVSDKYRFVIFDTPGSDSESHEEHLRVLKKTLGDQTNGLPILLTSPTDMDRTGADKLLKVVNGIGGNLDLPNAMIVVNQADRVSGKSLDKVKECAGTILSQWKSNRLYFLSAIMGLGSKKDDYEDEYAWIDDDYLDVFFKNIDSFTNSQKRVYKQLYTHNQIAQNRMERYMASVSDKKGDRALLYINSGLHCIENEILEFARKYMLYNKCSQAQKYLEEAIKLTKEKILSKEQEKENIEKKLNKEMDREKIILSNKLSECIKSRSKDYTNSYPEYMEKYVDSLVQNGEKEIRKFVPELWDKVKDSDRKIRIDKFLVSSKERFRVEKMSCKDKILEYSKRYWLKNKDDLQEECCKIVKADEDLSSDDKKYLEDFIMKLDIQLNTEVKINISPDDVSYRFDIFGHEIFHINHLKQNKAILIYVEQFKHYIRKVNTDINDKHTKEFKNWYEALGSGLDKRLSQFNPKLRELSHELDKCQKEIEMYQDQQKLIEEEYDKIIQMFDFKTKENK